jgi:hypothetical protein
MVAVDVGKAALNALYDFVLCPVDKTIALVKVMVEEQVPDASYGALQVFISCGLVGH